MFFELVSCLNLVSIIVQKLGSDHLALVTEFAFSKSAKDTILTMSAVSDGAISAYREDVGVPA